MSNAEEPTTQTFDVRSEGFAYFKGQITKLNKRAQKLGLEPIKYHVESESFKREHTVHPDGSEKLPSTEKKYKVLHIVVEGESPKLDGWQLVGVVDLFRNEDDSYSNIIRAVPGYQVPEKYRTVEPVCEHCNVRRRRKETFVIKHGDRYAIVGRNCLQDFLGGRSVDAIIWYSQIWLELAAQLEEREAGYGATVDLYREIEPYLAKVAAVVRVDKGFVSKRYATEQEEKGIHVKPTVYVVEGLELPLSYNASFEDKLAHEEEQRKYAITEEDEQVARTAIEWVLSKVSDDGHDYMYNIYTLTTRGHIRRKDYGLAASIIGSHKRFVEQAQERKSNKQKPGEYVGEIKKRQEFVVTLIGTKLVTGFYGDSTLWRLKDQEGNIITWFSSGQDPEIEEGKWYTVKATPKKHEEYSGRKQTVVNRLKVVETEAQGKLELSV